MKLAAELSRELEQNGFMEIHQIVSMKLAAELSREKLQSWVVPWSRMSQ